MAQNSSSTQKIFHLESFLKPTATHIIWIKWPTSCFNRCSCVHSNFDHELNFWPVHADQTFPYESQVGTITIYIQWPIESGSVEEWHARLDSFSKDLNSILIRALRCARIEGGEAHATKTLLGHDLELKCNDAMYR